MMKEPTLNDAIYALGIDGGWKLREGKIVQWWAEKEQQSNESIQAKLKELQAEYDAKKYQRDRSTSYPNIQEQLDMQYWDAVNGTKKWQEAVAKVKTDNPKPE